MNRINQLLLSQSTNIDDYSSCRLKLENYLAFCQGKSKEKTTNFFWQLITLLRIKNNFLISFNYLKSDKFYESWCILETIEIDLNNNPLIFKEEIGETTINNYTKSIIMLERYTKIGGTSLVLTKGSGVAQKLALKVLNYFKAEFENISEHPSIKELNTLIDLEMDDGHILKKTIEYGIAFHHAKLPNIIKTSINRRISAALSAL